MAHPIDPARELSSIRSIMERSSKVLFLSGLAGIAVGIVAVAGTVFARYVLTRIPPEEAKQYLIIDALIVLALSIALAAYYSMRMAKEKGLPVWNTTTRHLVVELAIPLSVGGIFCLSLLLSKSYVLMSASMLIFYGLALLNASKYTVREVRYLSFVELALGLFAAFVPNQSLNLWALGFGIVHILFGVRIYFTYER